ncbi:MAG: adenylate/guanylate cyclase domain-containing protein [Cyanobacteria bacterium J06592_8]
MSRFFSQMWQRITRLLYQRTILILTLLCFIGIAGSVWNMSRLTSNLIEAHALENAEVYAATLLESRFIYSSEVVSRITQDKKIRASHDYQNDPDAIPLPATYLIELGHKLGEMKPGMSVRLYSDYPFPWRQKTGGARDQFEREALTFLKKHPHQSFYRFEQFNGLPAFRYAQADIMKPSCIACHNSYPGTPKTDWKVGDVRGILELSQPLDNITKDVKMGLKGISILLTGLSILALSALTLVIGRLRQTSQELEQRVFERTSELRKANTQLLDEQKKSERLLLSILPQPIANRLKEGEVNIADCFAEATILFADIVGFTTLSEKVSPEKLLTILSDIFSDFDHLCDRYHLEKIKTIGDAYMVVGGLPNPRKDHAEAIAEMALDMLKNLNQYNAKNNVELKVRIGINSGPVIAGVIGKKKFIYDLWGDAVNIASRMESHGIAGEIQVTEATYHRLRSEFILVERGLIEIKGKGQMKTYLLKRRRESKVQFMVEQI